MEINPIETEVKLYLKDLKNDKRLFMKAINSIQLLFLKKYFGMYQNMINKG